MRLTSGARGVQPASPSTSHVSGASVRCSACRQGSEEKVGEEAGARKPLGEAVCVNEKGRSGSDIQPATLGTSHVSGASVKRSVCN